MTTNNYQSSPASGQVILGGKSTPVGNAIRVAPVYGAFASPSVMSSPPNLTLGAAGVSSITGGVLVPYNDPSFRVFQGWATAAAAFGGPLNSWQGSGITSPNSTPPYTVDFVTDAATFEINAKGNAGTVHIWVDGQAASAGPVGIGPVDGNPYYLAVAFGSVRPRRITVQFYTNVMFLGIQRPLTATVWGAYAPLGQRIIIMGDSFTEGTGDTDGANTAVWGGGFAARLAEFLGWPDVRMSGSGGTGYLNPGSGGRVKLRDRVQADVIANSPDIVIIAAGLDDQGYASANAVGGEATLLYQAIRTGLPNAKLIVIGPWWKDGSPPTEITDIRNAVQTAAMGYASLFIDPIAGGWITGTGHIGALANNGNADVYISSDGTHPSSAGHVYLASRLAQSIAAALPL